MKTRTYNSHFIFRTLSLALLILITFFGLSLKAQAQGSEIGNDYDRLKTSLKLKLNNSDLSVLIPRVSQDEMDRMENVSANQKVYLQENSVGFYTFLFEEQRWVKNSISEVLEAVERDIELMAPSTESIILTNAIADNGQLLDYNSHVAHINKAFAMNPADRNYAINKQKD